MAKTISSFFNVILTYSATMRLAFIVETLTCMYLFQNNALGAATFSGNAIVKLFVRYSFFGQNLMLRANFTFQGRRKMSDFLFRPTRVTLKSPSGAPAAPPPPPIMHRSRVPMSLKEMPLVKTRHKLFKTEIWCFLQKVK